MASLSDLPQITLNLVFQGLSPLAELPATLFKSYIMQDLHFYLHQRDTSHPLLQQIDLFEDRPSASPATLHYNILFSL